jgi:uncharacterized protein (DUF2235 family)
MSKNVVVCCDGTGNEFGERNTNVVKLYAVLERGEAQRAFYDPGVGTFSAPAALTRPAKAVTRALGLAFGLGVSSNVEDAYRFLMDAYEPGDRVFLFGFSRGAYVIRSLTALLYMCGLLPRGNENLIPYAMKMLKRERDPRVYGGFRRAFGRRCGVHFMGLWDTVKSVGWIYNPLKLPFTMRNPIVKTIRHAVAIDERRCFYRQNLWGDPLPHQDVQQVWFAGAHSDVGGSYPESESGLSQIALEWMIEEAAEHGLLVRARRYEEVVPRAGASRPAGVPAPASTRDDPGYVPPDPTGTLHGSLHGIWWLPELLPQRYMDRTRDFKAAWRIPRGRARHIEPGSAVHQSVIDRMRLSAYSPANLPAESTVVPWSARRRPGPEA